MSVPHQDEMCCMSSQRTRFQPEKVASTLCSYIKKSLKNVDLVMLQGGVGTGSQKSLCLS